MFERLIPRAVLGFLFAGSVALATVIARSPDTHGHLWASVPATYHRAPLDHISNADLQKTLSELPAFAFPSPTAAPARAVAQASDVVAAQKLTVRQMEFSFTPDRLAVKAGVPVELVVVNEGKQVHGMWMPEFAIAEDIRSGRQRVFKFTPTKPGRIRFVCSYNLCGSDEEHARMVGFITIEQ